METFLMDAAVGQRFCHLHTPPSHQALQASLVYVHPCAQERNASRQMAALQADAFACAGFAVLQMDLKGCGDSSGHFEEARWSDWIDDVQMARQWMVDRFSAPVWLWGLRAGCLLAAQVSRCEEMPAKLLFWQPVVSGKQHLQQFLRLHWVEKIAQNQCSSGTVPLAHKLAQGQSVEVAGYRIAPDLANGMSLSDLDHLHTGTEIISFELSSPVGESLSPALTAQVRRWQEAHCNVTAQAIEGAAFWQTQNASDCPNLIQASLNQFRMGTGSVTTCRLPDGHLP